MNVSVTLMIFVKESNEPSAPANPPWHKVQMVGASQWLGRGVGVDSTWILDDLGYTRR